MAKLDRLLNLTAALLETRVPMTAEEIRARVPGYSTDSDEAFHRAFERDKDDLRELGIPVETVTVGHHEQPRSAYTIERDRYELPDPGFELDELAAIQLAATAVQLEGLDRDDVDEGLRKLGRAGAHRRHRRAPRCGPDPTHAAGPVRRRARATRGPLRLPRRGAATCSRTGCSSNGVAGTSPAWTWTVTTVAASGWTAWTAR